MGFQQRMMNMMMGKKSPEGMSKMMSEIGLPPKKESSCNVRLELKIEGGNHGKEIAFSGADHQQAA